MLPHQTMLPLPMLPLLMLPLQTMAHCAAALRRSVTWDYAYTEHMRKTFITQDSPRPLVRLWSADFVGSGIVLLLLSRRMSWIDPTCPSLMLEFIAFKGIRRA